MVWESTSERAANGKTARRVLAAGRIGKRSLGKGFPIFDPGPNAVGNVRVREVRGPRAPTAGVVCAVRGDQTGRATVDRSASAPRTISSVQEKSTCCWWACTPRRPPQRGSVIVIRKGNPPLLTTGRIAASMSETTQATVCRSRGPCASLHSVHRPASADKR